jgi:hypothetical protein
MDPRDFLDVAGEWVTGTREAEWRSGVSRAYYATFHVARDLLRRCGYAGATPAARMWIVSGKS